MTVNTKESSSVGKLMILIGILVAVPLLVLPFCPEEVGYLSAFLIPALGSVILGAAICAASILFPRSGQQRGDISSITVLFTWAWGISTGALPFLLGGQLDPVQSLFEAVSGWTTTGLSVMDVSVTPCIYLFHRSFMQYCGGLGFVLMMVMLVSGKQSMGLFNAEGHPDKLMPNLKKTAQTIFVMYTSFLAIGTAAYMLAGMNFFDSLTHAMCALSTGGFSTKLNSIGEYSSLTIEIVTIVLMLIGTTNFAVLLLAARKKWSQVFRVSEIRFLGGLLVLMVPLTALSLSQGLGISLAEGFRKAAFDITSALSTSGFSTMSYAQWPPVAIGMMILAMLIGGGLGSTAGGIKLSRVYLVMRTVLLNISRRIYTQRRIQAPVYYKAQGKTPIDDELIQDTAGFVFCYLAIFIAGTLALTQAAGCTLTQGMFEFASSLGTVGLSIGLTGPATEAPVLWIEMFGMIMGRLEIFIVFIGIATAAGWLRRKLSPLFPL